MSIVSVFTRSIQEDPSTHRTYLVEPDKRIVTRISSNVYRYAALLACERVGRSKEGLPKDWRNSSSGQCERVERFRGTTTHRAMSAIASGDTNAVDLHSCTGGRASVMDDRIHASNAFEELGIPTAAYGRGAVCSASAGMFIHANRRVIESGSILSMHGRALEGDTQLLSKGSVTDEANGRMRDFAYNDFRNLYTPRFQNICVDMRTLERLYDYVDTNNTLNNPRIDIAFEDEAMLQNGLCTHIMPRRAMLRDFLSITRGRYSLSSRSTETDVEILDFFRGAPKTDRSDVQTAKNEFFEV